MKNDAYNILLLISKNKFLSFIICFIICFSSLSAENRLVKIGVYDNAPKIFMSENNQAAGIFIDIIEDIAKKENWKLEYIKGTWQECLNNLQSGTIDLMPDVAYTAERYNIYSFHSIPVLSSWSQVYTKKGHHIQSILDLNFKTIAVLGSSVQQQAFIHFTEGFEMQFNLLEFNSFEEAFIAVANNQADVAVANNLYGLFHAKQNGLEETGVVFNPSTLFFATLKNKNIDLLEKIDLHLNSMKENRQSAYYQALQKWISEEISYQFPLWIKIFSLIILFSLVVSIISGIILKNQVNLRTKELKNSYLEMEKKVQIRTSELAKAMEKAQQADNLKSAFLATMSHELRTPLNSIIGFTGILIQELAGPLNDEQKKQLSLVQKSSRHLLSLINDILDISKIESGQLKLDYSEFCLKESIEKVLKIIEPLATRKGLIIKSDISEKINTINCDQRRIEQVLLNLLSNAVKFTEKGEIKVTCTYSNYLCHISIKDSGIGMEKDELNKLFIPFSQVDKGLARKYEGTGLGLSICKKLVEKMKGEIKVMSSHGKGSTFSIHIPYTKEGIYE